MKTIILTVMALVAITSMALAQEQLVIETTYGYQRTFDVKDISRIYFTTAEEIADDCEIDIEDEVVLTTCAAFEFSYDDGIEYVYAGYFTAEQARSYTDDQIVAMLKAGGNRLGKQDTMFGNNNLQEGTDYVLAYVGFNAQDKRGQLYMHPYKTSVLADIQAKKHIANVTDVKYNDSYFFFTVEADEVLVGEYYMMTEVGNDLTLTQQNMALIGLAWKKLMDQDEKAAGQHFFGDDFSEARPNGENSLRVVTWATDSDWDLVGFIFEGIWNISPATRSMQRVAKQATLPNYSCYNKQQLLEQLRQSVKIYRVIQRK